MSKPRPTGTRTMSIDHYLINHRGFDWSQLLREWRWLLPPKFTVWIMNRFGDLFLVLEDGSVHRLDLSGGTLEKVAANREDFSEKLDEGDNADDWLMIPLVDRLVAHGMTLTVGRCYGYKQQPILGGDYTVKNICVLSIDEHYRFCGTIQRQLKDVPDGGHIVIKWTD